MSHVSVLCYLTRLRSTKRRRKPSETEKTATKTATKKIGLKLSPIPRRFEGTFAHGKYETLSCCVPVGGHVWPAVLRHASSIVFSNVRGNGLLCGCFPGQGSGVGTSSLDPVEHFTRADAFAVPTAGDYTLDSIALAVGHIGGDSPDGVHKLGRPWGRGTLLNLPDRRSDGAFGTDHPLLIINSQTHPVVEVGSVKWLVVAPISSVDAGWYSNIRLAARGSSRSCRKAALAPKCRRAQRPYNALLAGG